MSDPGANQDYFSVRRSSGLAIIDVSAEIEHLSTDVIETAAQYVLSPLKADPPSSVIVDLSKVRFFGSEFISFLLRCHMIVKKSHGELALAGVSEAIRELLRQTALDTLWPIYATRLAAITALAE